MAITETKKAKISAFFATTTGKVVAGVVLIGAAILLFRHFG